MSSVLIAGAGSASGASRAVLTMAEIGLFEMLVSPQVLDECERNLKTTGINIQSPSEFVQQIRQVIGQELAE